ncbi:MAG: adenylate/guanylate cyclase domain-containing protein [Rhodobacteraceae bacterium]|nr:adenylate/guanylate cyclase domain-containing protein [Paracoccaceae bacterium]
MRNLDPATEVAVMVADISGSTALYDSVGNAAALSQINACLALLHQITEAHGGQFVHSKGDDVVCVFEHPQKALDAVVEILAKTRNSRLTVHAGIDFGPVIRTSDDVFGDCVNVTSRLAGLANSGEVLCSQGFRDQLDAPGKAMLRFFDTWRFKGKSEGAHIYAFSDLGPGVETQISFVGSEEVTQQPGPRRGNLHRIEAELTADGQVFRCTPDQAITVGRSPDCDLVVPKPWVSRFHAVVEIHHHHVYLRDTSSNGTYVCFEGQRPVLARREAVLLPFFCQLSLTKHPDAEEADPIECKVNSPFE